MQHSVYRLQRDIALTLAIAASLAAPAYAQEEESSSSGRVETVIVTAQKREQNLQDVPIVITALSEQLLEDNGVRDIKDLQLLTPGLTVTSTSNEALTTARIRGIGTVGDNPGLESSVGVVIDGVYRPRNGVGFGDLGELERIEVLKGPQGTLFGKNTSAGVINVVSKRPSFKPSAEVEVSGGDFSAFDVSGSVNGGLIDNVLAGRLFAAHRERDGFYDVRLGAGPRTDDEDADRSFYTVRGQLLFQPTDNLNVLLIGDYSDRDETCCAAVQLNVGASAPIIDALSPDSGVANPADAFDRTAFLNRPTDQRVLDRGVSAELNWDLNALGGATFTAISAFRNWETVNAQDADYTSVDILYRLPGGSFSTEFQQFSQELRLAGEIGKVNWLVGLFYANEDLDSNNQLLVGDQFQTYYSLLLSQGTSPTLVGQLTGLGANAYRTGTGQNDIYRQESDTIALFTNNSWQVTDAIELTLGLRYTNEQKDLDTSYSNIGNGVGCAASRARLALISGALPAAALGPFFAFGCSTFGDPVFNNVQSAQSFDENEGTGTTKLAYRVNDDILTYISYARGYKASGFNLDRERLLGALGPADPMARADLDTKFDAEIADSFELGAKTQWFDDTLVINAAAFYQEFSDFQLNTFTGISFIVTSLPEVRSAGLDADVVWYTPLESLTIQGGFTYADTEITDFGSAITLFSPQRKDDRLSFAPEFSASLAGTFEQPLGGNLMMRLNLSGKFTSEYNTGSDLNPGKIQSSFVLLNARAGIGSADQKWTVEVFAQNLTDKDYYQVVFDGALQPGTRDAFLGTPRVYGITGRMKF